MAWHVPPSQTTTETLLSGDDVFVGGIIAITVESGYGIRGAFSGHHALIYGLVANAGSSTISLGTSGVTDSGHVVEVKAGGHVEHLGTSIAVYVQGFNSSIINAGLISSPFGYGVWIAGTNALTASTLNNSGTIEGGVIGIDHDGSETLVMTNSGTIKAGVWGVPRRRQCDRLHREHWLAGRGRVARLGQRHLQRRFRPSDRPLLASDGNDIVVGGIDNDWFEGGTENDALAGNGGDDRLLGQAGNDILNGGLGNDILDGGIGNDTLFGGAGKDDLTGGANNDFFVFNTALNASTNRDTVSDFSHADDTFRLENAVFTKLGAGVHRAEPGLLPGRRQGARWQRLHRLQQGDRHAVLRQ